MLVVYGVTIQAIDACVDDETVTVLSWRSHTVAKYGG